MAQNPQGSKQKWKVGSFLQQAVAGVESKLDLILAEEEQQQQQQQQMQSRNAAAKAKQVIITGYTQVQTEYITMVSPLSRSPKEESNKEERPMDIQLGYAINH